MAIPQEGECVCKNGMGGREGEFGVRYQAHDPSLSSKMQRKLERLSGHAH